MLFTRPMIGPFFHHDYRVNKAVATRTGNTRSFWDMSRRNTMTDWTLWGKKRRAILWGMAQAPKLVSIPVTVVAKSILTMSLSPSASRWWVLQGIDYFSSVMSSCVRFLSKKTNQWRHSGFPWHRACFCEVSVIVTVRLSSPFVYSLDQSFQVFVPWSVLSCRIERKDRLLWLLLYIV